MVFVLVFVILRSLSRTCTPVKFALENWKQTCRSSWFRDWPGRGRLAPLSSLPLALKQRHVSSECENKGDDIHPQKSIFCHHRGRTNSMANKQSFFDCKKAKGGGIDIPKAFRYFNSLDTDTSSSPLRKSRSASLLDIFDTHGIDFNPSSFISKMDAIDEASVGITIEDNIEQQMQKKHCFRGPLYLKRSCQMDLVRKQILLIPLGIICMYHIRW